MSRNCSKLYNIVPNTSPNCVFFYLHCLTYLMLMFLFFGKKQGSGFVDVKQPTSQTCETIFPSTKNLFLFPVDVSAIGVGPVLAQAGDTDQMQVILLSSFIFPGNDRKMPLFFVN